MTWIADTAVAVVSGVGVALLIGGFNRLFQLRKANKARRWFGTEQGEEWIVSLPRFYADQRAVSFTLLTAVDEIGRLADTLGCAISLVPNDELTDLGTRTEISIGGGAEGRPAVHIRNWVPELQLSPWDPDKEQSVSMKIGDETYRYEPRVDEYALLARIELAETQRPLFLIVGQGATADVAAVTYLSKNHQTLRQRFNTDSFAILIRIKESGTYGIDHIEEVQLIETKASNHRAS